MQVLCSKQYLNTIATRQQTMKDQGWPYYALLQQVEEHYAITDWCYKFLKPNETVTWHGMQFWFKNEQDLMLFTLTWL